MENALDNVELVICSFTNDELLDFDPQTPRTVQEVVRYLNQNPRNAVVISDLKEESGECVAVAPQFVLRGASEQLNNFYYGPYPSEDPNDADGGDLDAITALYEALNALTG